MPTEVKKIITQLIKIPLLTPGGALAKRARSDVHLMSEYALYVKPHNVNLIRDSLAVVSGTTKDVNRSLTSGLGLEVYYKIFDGRVSLSQRSYSPGYGRQSEKEIEREYCLGMCLESLCP